MEETGRAESHLHPKLAAGPLPLFPFHAWLTSLAF